MGTTHAIGGFLAAELLVRFGNVPASEIPLVVAASVIGSLLPDVDHPNSLVGRRAPVVSDAVGLIFGHRGFTHSLLFAGAVFLFLALFRVKCAAWLPLSVLGGLGVGIVSHLIFDMLNPSPVPLLWPWKKEFRLPLPGIPVGSFPETVFRAAAVAVTVLLFPVKPLAAALVLPGTLPKNVEAEDIVRKGLQFTGEILRIVGDSLEKLSQKVL